MNVKEYRDAFYEAMDNMWKGRTPDDLVKRVEELEFKLANEQNRADSAVRFLRFFIVLSLGLMICLLS